MTDHINDALRLKSLIFWLNKLNAMKKLDPPAFIHSVWNKKDYPLFQGSWNTCPWCHGESVFDPMDGDKSVIIEGVLIERIQCICMTLEFRSRTASRWYESSYIDTKLQKLAEIDIPYGAAKRTASIKTWVEKFLANPTRSATITGGTGSGKTHILQSIKTELGGHAVYITAGDFYGRLMGWVGGEKSGQIGKFIEKLTYADILLFDDYGLAHPSPWALNTLAQIIDSRYARRQLAPTIITTNKSMVEMQPGAGSVTNDDRLLSRMMDADNSRVLIMLQADWRNKDIRKEAGK